MRWRGERESSNIEDRRGFRIPGGGIALGGGGGLVVLIIALLLGADPRDLLRQQTEQTAGTTGVVEQGNPQEEELAHFVAVVLAETEDVWRQQFAAMGREYREPKLVLFRQRVESACGLASAAVGPFYCPEDEKLYIDLGFYELLKQRFQAPGDFAQAYVIAHEVGHHVQKLLGIESEVERARAQASETEANQLSVRLELQADFLAGVWARSTESMKQLLEPGDIQEALQAASAIGDDAIQRQTQGEVVPDSFTHGTSEQRMRWFMKGYETGDIRQGDTFSATTL